jgi:pimeloyl-ACP methyl ester carboxylesterase
MDYPRSLISKAGSIKDDELRRAPECAYIPGAEEYTLTLNGLTWRYLRAGSGPALVLVHGLLGYSWSWRFNIRELSRNFTVYAPDLLGCGFSQRSDSLCGSLESDADGLIALMDHLGVDQFYLVGSSRGGGLAVVLAGLLAQRGMLHRLPRMILSAPINPWSGFGRRRAKWFAMRLGQQYVIHVTPRLPSILEMYYRKLYGDPTRIAEGSVAGYAAGLLVPRSFHHLASIMRGWHDDLRQVEATLPLLQDLPILLLWGSQDVAVYPSSAFELQDRLANAALLAMEGIGHLPYEEVPAEFNHIVCQFLLRHDPATPLEISVRQDSEPAMRAVEARTKANRIRNHLVR